MSPPLSGCQFPPRSMGVTGAKGVSVPSCIPWAEVADNYIKLLVQSFSCLCKPRQLVNNDGMAILITITNACLLNIYSPRGNHCHSSLTSNFCSPSWAASPSPAEQPHTKWSFPTGTWLRPSSVVRSSSLRVRVGARVSPRPHPRMSHDGRFAAEAQEG